MKHIDRALFEIYELLIGAFAFREILDLYTWAKTLQGMGQLTYEHLFNAFLNPSAPLQLAHYSWMAAYGADIKNIMYLISIAIGIAFAAAILLNFIKAIYIISIQIGNAIIWAFNRTFKSMQRQMGIDPEEA